jgi:hypothetical protein
MVKSKMLLDASRQEPKPAIGALIEKARNAAQGDRPTAGGLA